MPSANTSRRSCSAGFSLAAILSPPPAPRGRPDRQATRDCRGMDWDRLLPAVAATLAAEDEDLVEKVLGFVRQAQETPQLHPVTGEVCRDDDGQVIHEQHF